MVQFKFLAVFVVLLTQSTFSEDLGEHVEESKKVILVSKEKRSGEKPFECDLVLSETQKKIMYYSMKSDSAVDAYQWPKNRDGHAIVPYQIMKSAHYSDEHLKLIRRAMDTIESETCVRFRYRTHQHDFVNIYSGRYCKSNLGRTGGMQEISLNRKTCMEKGIIMHELLHALGYIHMHSRPDRDKYVNILWKNIQPKWFSEFNRVNPNIFMHLGTPYDYHSIMHYGSTAFTKNGGHTIMPKNEAYLHSIGQRGGLSEGDIKRINNRYKCKVEKAYPQLLNHISHFTSSSEYLPKPQEYSYSRTTKDINGFVPVINPGYSFSKTKDADVDDLFNL